jgi:hypothetical protein
MAVSAQRLAELKRRASKELRAASLGADKGAEWPASLGAAQNGTHGGGSKSGAPHSSAPLHGSSAGGCGASLGSADDCASLSLSLPSSAIGSTSSATSAAGSSADVTAADLLSDRGTEAAVKVTAAVAASRVVDDPAAAADPRWVSTRDCLVARLAQLLHSIPLKNRPGSYFFVIANMRQRAVPRLPDNQLGNWVWGARVDGVAPSQTGLGELAAGVRAALHRWAAPAAWPAGVLRKCPWQPTSFPSLTTCA